METRVHDVDAHPASNITGEHADASLLSRVVLEFVRYKFGLRL